MIARSGVLMIEVVEFDSKSSDSRSSDLLHRSSDLLHQMIELRGSLVIDSLIHYSLIHMMNCCCSSNVIFASMKCLMFDSMKFENNKNLETIV